MLPSFHLGGKEIPMYGLCMTFGMLLACATALLKARQTGKDGNSLMIIAASAIGGGLLGAKLLYIITSYGLTTAISQIAAGDWRCLNGGGLVFYGGLLGGIGFAFLGSRLAKEEISNFEDAIVPAIPLGHAFGRVGCFFAGCCYGIPYDGPFSVHFPQLESAVFPIQLLEAALNIMLALVLWCMASQAHKRYHLLGRYVIAYAVIRFVLEFGRGDIIRGSLYSLSASQWISMALFVVAFAMILIDNRKSAKQH